MAEKLGQHMILLELFRERVLGQAPKRSIPTMDGAWRPNDRLETCARLALDVVQPTGLATGPDGTLFIASGQTILSARGPDYASVSSVGDVGGSVRALTWHPSLGLVAAVTGRGVVLGVDGPKQKVLSETDAGSLKNPTDVVVATDGSVFVTEGSSRIAGEHWVRDLMGKGEDGRLVRFAPGAHKGETIARGLAFPTGVGLEGDGTPIVCEAWRHRLLRIGAKGPQVMLDNLPAYPGSLLADGDGWWLSLFAPRSHIVEFVLEEDGFRQKMMEHIDPAFWISPSTDPREHHFQPVQVGSLRSQNIKKPWAPARSYGLVARLDAAFNPQRSYHSRSNGTRHGISAMTMLEDTLVVASEGANAILRPQIGQE